MPTRIRKLQLYFTPTRTRKSQLYFKKFRDIINLNKYLYVNEIN